MQLIYEIHTNVILVSYSFEAHTRLALFTNKQMPNLIITTLIKENYCSMFISWVYTQTLD
jgi:hypothetical protein